MGQTAEVLDFCYYSGSHWMGLAAVPGQPEGQSASAGLHLRALTALPPNHCLFQSLCRFQVDTTPVSTSAAMAVAHLDQYAAPRLT